MKFEKTIQLCFDSYPSLFQRREQVLDHLFCVIGNGYDWVKGELRSDEDDGECSDRNPLLNNKAHQYHPVLTKKMYRETKYKEIKSSPSKIQLWSEILEPTGITLEEKFLSPKEDDDEPQYPFKHEIYPLCKKYSYLLNYPENIKKDWLLGIKETLEYIIEFIDENQTFGEKDKSSVFGEITKAELVEIYNTKFKDLV